jgi:hypothetical protein
MVAHLNAMQQFRIRNRPPYASRDKLMSVRGRVAAWDGTEPWAHLSRVALVQKVHYAYVKKYKKNRPP